MTKAPFVIKPARNRMLQAAFAILRKDQRAAEKQAKTEAPPAKKPAAEKAAPVRKKARK